MKLISVFASFGMLFTLTACGQTDSDGDSYDWNDFEPDNEDIAYRDVSPDVNTFGFTMRIISQCDVKINKVDSDSISFKDENTMKAWLQWAKENNVHYDWSSDQNYP